MTQINITNETHNHKVIINNETRTVEVFSTGKRGLRGEIGVSWLNDSWSTGVSYSKHQALLHEGSTYRVIEDHVSTTSTEPGKGTYWQTVWMLLALGSSGSLFAQPIIFDGGNF